MACYSEMTINSGTSMKHAFVLLMEIWSFLTKQSVPSIPV